MIRIWLAKYYYLVLMFVLISLLVTGCTDEPKSSQAPSSVKKTKPPVKKVLVEEPSETVENVPKRFVYSPTGRRDPFEPLVKKGNKTKSSTVPLTPLQRFDLGQFRLQAVLVGKGAPRAMVSAPDGKTYILSPGIKIGKREGVVTDITRESVQVEEVHYDVSGVVSKKLASINMPEQKSF